jgi:prevent-host-death family protein
VDSTLKAGDSKLKMGAKLNTRTMAAGEFKAKCLAVMDEVQAKRTTVVVTKNGKPVAKMVPIIDETVRDPIFGFMLNKLGKRAGEVKLGDVESPIYTEAEYEEFYRRKDEMYGRTGKLATK